MIAYQDGVAALEWLAEAFGFIEQRRFLAPDVSIPSRRKSSPPPRVEDLEGHRWMFMERPAAT
jgi:uncharacterized glyoxalase superfamily protein PhnB